MSAPDPRKLQHVAYFDEGAFHWMSGIAPRDCELYAGPVVRTSLLDSAKVLRDGGYLNAAEYARICNRIAAEAKYPPVLKERV